MSSRILHEELASLIADLSAAAVKLEGHLNPQTAASLADLVRIMNCYYSNLIEGHNTRPKDIEAALEDQLSTGERRDLQLEARAHIRVQRLIDERHAAGQLGEPASVDFIRWVHGEFYQEAPESLLLVEGANTRFLMTPGQFRSRPEEDNVVGRHRPPSSGSVSNFMAYFESRYRTEQMSKAARISSIATAHHRFNFIHPFPDGNGRVSRLMSHAMALRAGIGAHGMWSISRGLARGLKDRSEYRFMMDAADSPREGDLDGRGNLSLHQLRQFVSWFLQVCLDQVQFMASLFELNTLKNRLHDWTRSQRAVRSEGGRILESVLLHGELARGEALRASGLAERTARDILAKLLRTGILASDTPKGPVRLRFSVGTAEVLFPRLFMAQS